MIIMLYYNKNIRVYNVSDYRGISRVLSNIETKKGNYDTDYSIIENISKN